MARPRLSTARRAVIAVAAVALVPLTAMLSSTGAQPVSGGGNVTIGPAVGLATPAPSNLAVAGLSGAISDLEITITNLSSNHPDDVDMMLQGPGGQTALLMSDVGGATDVAGLSITFDDEAPGMIADGGPLVSGRFRLSDVGTTDSLPAPAPARPYATTLSVFDGTNPNGTWQLWVADDAAADAGTFAGWSLKLDVGPTGGPLTFPAGGPALPGQATPYPSNVNVTGLTGTVDDVNVTFEDLNHGWLDDVDVLVVAPSGQSVVLMSDVGGSNDAVALDLTFDDSAAASLSDSGAIARGAYKPTNVDSGVESFTAPAPAGPHGATLAAFDGIAPNGTWSLFIEDDAGGDAGTLRAWSLEITTVEPPPTTTTTTAPPPDDPCVGFPDRFTDDVDNVHEERINCMAGLGLTEGGPAGLPPTQYGPALSVTRAQMASFMARTIEHEGIALPADPPDAFTDDNSSVHQERINQLADVGVIGGNGESGSSYFPQRSITRGEMASFLNQAHRVIAGALLPAAPDQFPDDNGSPYEDDINSLFAVDIVQGRTDGTYAPLASVRRDAMASFIIRLVRYVETGTAGG